MGLVFDILILNYNGEIHKYIFSRCWKVGTRTGEERRGIISMEEYLRPELGREGKWKIISMKAEVDVIGVDKTSERREKKRKKWKDRPLENGHINGREQRTLVE